MKFEIEISRQQFSNIHVEADNIDDAIEKAMSAYYSGEIYEWCDYEKGVDVCYCSPVITTKDKYEELA